MSEACCYGTAGRAAVGVLFCEGLEGGLEGGEGLLVGGGYCFGERFGERVDGGGSG